MKEVNRETAFTLVELLVVISIIGLISSVAVASLNSAREKGRIAAGKQFEANIYHSAGDQAVGIWDFDECTGLTLVDRSGSGNNGTLSNMATSSWTGNSPSGVGCSLLFDGANDFVNLGNSNSNFDFQGDFTISHWINANSLTSGPSGACAVRHPSIANNDYGWGIVVLSNGDVKFHTYYSSSNGENLTAPAAVTTGRWHHVVAVKTGPTKNLYVDGTLRASGGTQAAVYYSGSDFPAFGYQFCGGNYYYWDGFIDSVKIYSKALTASEVGKLYAESVSKYRFAEIGSN